MRLLRSARYRQASIDPVRFVHETVGCAMRTDRLIGVHGALCDPAGNLG